MIDALTSIRGHAGLE